MCVAGLQEPNMLVKSVTFSLHSGLAHDSRNNLYFWIAFGGQSPLYRFESTNEELSRLVQILDNPVSLAADWVGRRLFWVQDGIGVSYIIVQVNKRGEYRDRQHA